MAIRPKRVVEEIGQYQAPEEGRHSLVRLDFNEHTEGFPHAYPPGLPHVLVSAYPEYGDFIGRLAQFYELPPDWLLLTNGSDEALFVIPQTFIEPGHDTAIVSTPCFTMIPHCLKLAGAELKEIPVLADLQFDHDGIEEALKGGARVAIFASPENPTGSLLDSDVLGKWCHQFADTLFVVDEAYAEFAGATVLPMVNSFDNLLVLKTFSKAWGMAGLRLGVIFGRPYLLEYLRRVKLPYSVNAAALWTASKLLDDWQRISQSISSCVDRKEKLVSSLRKNGYRVDNGASNSFLFGAGMNADRLTNYCRTQGILVRNRSKGPCPVAYEQLDGDEITPSTAATKRSADRASAAQPSAATTVIAAVRIGQGRATSNPMWGKVRVSVGTADEHERFLQAIEKFHSSYGLIFDLDGTLVDTSKTFDAVVADVVQQFSGAPLADGELARLRQEGGYNDDWVAARELLHRRGVDVPMIEVTAKALSLYLAIAAENETLLVTEELLKRLRQRHPLFIVTGRSRSEYEPIWAKRLDPLFDRIYCQDDVPGHAPKPAPDYLLRTMRDHGLAAGVYVGNSVDDMYSARDASLDRIGITTTLPAEVLRSAGAQLVLHSTDLLSEVFMT